MSLIEQPTDSAGNVLAVGDRCLIVKWKHGDKPPQFLGSPVSIMDFAHSATCIGCGWRYLGWIAHVDLGSPNFDGAPCEWLLKLPKVDDEADISAGDALEREAIRQMFKVRVADPREVVKIDTTMPEPEKAT